MLWQIGMLTCDTFPFEVSKVRRTTQADFAKHALVSVPEDYEFSGPGTRALDLSGQLLPFHLGGLAELEIAHALCASGQAQWVVRGDGRVFGWYAFITVEDEGEYLAPNGVGFVVKYRICLERVPDPTEAAGSAIIGALLTLFG